MVALPHAPPGSEGSAGTPVEVRAGVAEDNGTAPALEPMFACHKRYEQA